MTSVAPSAGKVGAASRPDATLVGMSAPADVRPGEGPASGPGPGGTVAPDAAAESSAHVGRAGRLGVCAAVGVLALLVLVPVSVLLYVWKVAGADDLTRSDAVIVLGASQFDGRPSPVLAARLDHAASLLREGVAPRVITVGGKQRGDRFTEAEAGRRYLAERGLPATALVSVGEGSDTVASLEAAARSMAEHGWSTATLVTDPAHEARSLAIARRLGIDARTSPTQRGDGSNVTAEYLAREAGGLLRFWAVEQWALRPVLGG